MEQNLQSYKVCLQHTHTDAHIHEPGHQIFRKWFVLCQDEETAAESDNKTTCLNKTFSTDPASASDAGGAAAA